MTFQSADMENTTIGELLRETRIKRGLDLLAVAEETKISPRNLQAIEDGNFSTLPAEVFTRGFYIMYARMLSLDPDEVLTMYGLERKKSPKTGIHTTPPPNRLAQDMANMAERPTSLPSSYFCLVVFIFLLFGAFLCWYFSWNPASFLSEKLRSLEEPQIEQVMNEETEQEKPELNFAAAMAEAPQPFEKRSLFSPSTVTAATTQPIEYPKAPMGVPVQPRYSVNAVFQEETSLSLQIDDQSEHTLAGKSGESITWHAGKKITITLPGDTKTRLTLNNIPVELPQATNDTIRLSIPEDLLR